MRKIKHLYLILILAFCPLTIEAQDDVVTMGLRAGHNAVFGGFAAFSLETQQTFCKDFSLCGGLQYNTIGKTSLDVRPSYQKTYEWGKLSAEALLTFTNLSSINNFSAGCGVDLDFKSVSAKLGYYYRMYYCDGDMINEPFNIYYEFRAHFLRKVEKWILDLVLTNSEIFELERHYQPSYLAETCYNPRSKIGITFGIGCKPAGPFNLSVDYYQSFIKTGLCYRW